ncbi:hypothetical protein [Sphingobium sp.]|uniref:hypothetical protein n=1 Tax=Sphingobium sp. TaxID=1912891 RepID=UPI003BB5272C
MEESDLVEDGLDRVNSQPVIEGAYRGVIYGTLPSGAKKDVEIFANGLSLGIASIISAGSSSRQSFILKVPVDLLVAAPVTLGCRFAGDEDEGNVLELADKSSVLESLTVATGQAAVSGGMISGVLERVNPDALPLTICVTTRGQVIGKKVLPRTTGQVVGLAGARTGAIPEIRFSIPLPIDLLDTIGARISVRLEGAQWELDGCPILITVSNGDTILHRLSTAEARVEELTANVKDLHDKLITSLMKQYADVIIPRVDAIVTLQRTALERQMVALSLAVPEHHFTPMPRELPMDALFMPGLPFVGHGWAPSALGPRFLAVGRQAFAAFEIATDYDAVIIIEGGGDSSIEVLQSMAVLADDRPVDLTHHADTGSGIWWSMGKIPRNQIGAEGLLMLKMRGPSVRSGNQVVAVRQITVLSMGWGHDKTGGSSEPRLLAGFHDHDEMPDGTAFQWMSGNGLMAVPCDPTTRRLVIRGPMVLSDEQGRSLRVLTENGDVCSLDWVVVPGGWQAEMAFTPPDRSFALVRLICDARQPDNGDTRSLSVAISNAECLA